MKKMFAPLIFAAIAAITFASAQPGPGPQPNPWVKIGNDISYSLGGILAPSSVTGGSKGAGTINASNVYVNGNAVTYSVFGRTGAVTAQSGDYSFSLISGTAAATQGGTGLTSGTSGGVLYFNSGTTIASSASLLGNQLVLGGGSGGAPVTLGSLGTTSTVLHGNASGAPTWGAVALATDVSGTLPVANGGTGITAFGTGIAAALGVNVGSAGAPVLFNGAGGTPSSLVCTNCSGSASALSIGGNAATATSATNVAGGVAGAVHYQSGVGATGFTAAGSTGQILRSAGTGAPTWSTATYPSAAGSSGNLLTSDGTNWVSSAASAGVSQTTGTCGTLPTITASVSNPTITAYTTQLCTYVKTGKTVTNTVQLVWTSSAGGSGFGQITNGISDTPTSSDAACAIGYFPAPGLSVTYSYVTLLIPAGSTTLYPWAYNLTGGTNSRMSSSNFAGTQAITYSCTYQIP